MGDIDKVHIELSWQEADAIERWRVAHRLPTVDEAARRLLRLGLRVAESSGEKEDLDAAAD